MNSGYQIVGWSKEANANPTVWPLNKSGDTACNKGTTIYLVAKNPNPEVTYTLNYYKNTTDTVTNMPAPNPQTETSSTGTVTFTVSDKRPERADYTFLGWAGNPDATTPTVQPGNWVTTTATTTKLYAVWQSNTPPTDKPAKPTENDVTGVVVDIVCVTTTGTHDTVQYPLGFATTPQHTIGEVASDGAGGYICPVTVRTAWFVQQASNLRWKVQHTPTAQTITFNLTYDKNSKTWVKPAANPRIEATHEVTPDTPGDQKPNIEEANAKIRVQCIEYPSKHNPYTKNYRILPGSYEDLGWDQTEYGYIYSIRLNRAKYIAQFDQEIGRPHTDTEPNEETRINWRWENGAWHLIGGPDGIDADIKVKCAETPVKPEKPTALDGSFAIVCKNNKATHPYKADYIATPRQYTISDVQMDDQGYYVTATVTVAPNLAAYNTATRAEHRLVNEQDATLTITFRYNPKATGDGNRKWQQQGDLPVVEVICKEIEEPTREDIFKALNGLVTVTCINRFWKDGNKNMDCGQGQYAAKAGIVGQEYTLEKGEDAGTWVVTFPVTNFVKSFKQDPAHHLYTKNTLSWYIRWKDNAWTSAPVEPGVDDLVKLTHAPTDWREVAKIATGGKSDCIHVSVNGETGVCDYGITVPFVYSATDVVSVEPEDGVPGSYIATFKVDRYIDTCAKACNDKNFKDAPRTHKLLTQETVQWRLYATPEADEKIGNNVPNHVWEAEPVKAGKDDVCTIAHNWVVTFNPDNGGDTFKQNVEYEGKAIKPTPDPEKTGYTFDGWYLDEAEAPFSFDTTITSDITLKAKWNINKYTVTFNSYGGTPVPPAQEVEYGHTATKPADPTLKGYTFAFWYLGEDEQNATAYDFDTPVTENITLTAKWNINKYTVAFNTDGGTPVPPAQEVEYGLTATEPAAPEKTGYTFDGWYLGDEKYDFSAAVEQNITLTAKWTQNTYTVTFDPNGGNELAEADKTKAVKIGEAYGELPTPTRKGYNFAGWYTEAEEGTVVTADTTVSAMTDHTLYAHWEAKKANVHIMIFKSNDLGTPIVDRAYTTDAVYGDTLDLAEIDPSSYLDFDFEIDGGWYDDGLFNLYKKYVSGEQANKPAALTKLQITGNWQNLKLIVTELVPVVYFKSAEALAEYQNDHSKVENIIFTTKARVGSTLPTADAPTATRDGYTFTFWSREGQIGTDVTGQTVNGWTNLVANWEARTDTPYTVEHYLENLDGNYALDTTEHLKGTTDTTVTAAAKSYDNFTYDSTVPGTVASGNIAGDGSLVLKLFYTRNTYDYTVRHIKQLPDGSYDEANAEVETLSGKFEALAAVTAKDYGEHYPTNDADTKQNIKIEKGLTIDVKYDLDEHTLTFETNGGSAINPVTVRHGNAVARPADPTKDKYTFIGWYADPEFTEEYDFATVLEADKTIYAKFELTSTPIGDIYVRYDVLHIKQLPDGTYDLANAEVEHLSAKKDTTVTAVIKDYRATHHVNVNRTLSKLTGTAIQPYMGVDGKPVYTILSVYYDLDFHTLTFDTMGGSKIAPETVRHGLTVAKPKDPVNGGYWFDGWYTDKTYRTPYNFATPLTQDTTIYAKWFLIVLPGVTVKKNTPKLNTADHFAYVQGYPDGTVKPAGNITRAETAAILFRLMDDASRKTYYSTKSGFRDVASGSWYNTYVATLNNAGVITDSSNGYFRPNEAITRAELAAMLAKFSETTGAANYFNDVSAKYWAANAIAICAKLGWINGYPDGTFRPDRNVTRAELMAMINRATGRAPKSADAFLPGMKTWIDNTSDKWYYLDVQEATNSHSYTVKGSETWTALTSDPNWSLYE